MMNLLLVNLIHFPPQGALPIIPTGACIQGCPQEVAAHNKVTSLLLGLCYFKYSTRRGRRCRRGPDTSRPATVEGIQRPSAVGETGELDLADVTETTDENLGVVPDVESHGKLCSRLVGTILTQLVITRFWSVCVYLSW